MTINSSDIVLDFCPAIFEGDTEYGIRFEGNFRIYVCSCLKPLLSKAHAVNLSVESCWDFTVLLPKT